MEGGGALGTLARLTLAGSVSSNKRSSLGRSLTPASLHNLNGSVVSCNTSLDYITPATSRNLMFNPRPPDPVFQ